MDLLEEDLEELQPQIKEVRADIEKLEKLLQKRGLCISVSVFSHDSREFGYSEDGDFTQVNEYVEWAQIGDEWRLTLRLEQAEGCLAINEHPYAAYPLAQLPLIEAEEAMQLRANHVLGEFAEKVGEVLKAHKRRELDFVKLEDESPIRQISMSYEV